MASAYQETRQYHHDVRSFVDQELRQGVNGDSFGYHGTSVYTLLHMLRTGVVPGKSTPENPEFHGYPKPGDVYFWKRQGSDYQGQSAKDAASHYARQIARKHFFIEQLRLNYNDPDHHYAALELANHLCSEEERALLIQQLDLTGSQVMNVADSAQPLRGVLLGLLPSITGSYEVIDCKPDDGWKVETRIGLPYYFIDGIQFLSSRDQQLFDQLHAQSM